jgi:AraC family transcriptional regulator
MKQDTFERHTERMHSVLRHISSNLDESPSLKELSKLANCAPFHFHRVFRELTGEPVRRYIRRLRLELAAHRLLFTDRSVIRIALEAGYESHEAFTRAFKQSFGSAPVDFRKAFTNGSSQARMLLPPGIEIRKLPRRKVAFYSFFGAYEEVGEAWRKLDAWLRSRGLRPDGLEAVGIVHDDPEYCFGASIRYDACIPVSFDFVPVDEIGLQVLPEMDSICTAHEGPHELAVHTYIRLINSWVRRSGQRGLHRLPYYEVFRRLPFDGGRPDPAFEIHVALA